MFAGKNIAKNISDSIFCSIMASEVTDCSIKEQFRFRWVDKGFNTHEDFIASYKRRFD